MRTLTAAGLALMMSWGCARIFLRMNQTRIKRWAPLWEEGWKAIFSWLLPGTLWIVHVLFGLGEALYEWKHDKSPVLFLVNISVHGTFGVVAILFLSHGRWAGWLASTFVHLLWNHLILNKARQTNV